MKNNTKVQITITFPSMNNAMEYITTLSAHCWKLTMKSLSTTKVSCATTAADVSFITDANLDDCSLDVAEALDGNVEVKVLKYRIE